MKTTSAIFAALLLMVTISASYAHTPKGGLGDVAVSPDGATIVVGGDSRTLYVVDPATLDVTKRIWVKTNIYEMAFNKDGSLLAVEDVDADTYFFRTSDWSHVSTVKAAGSISAAPAADLLAGLSQGSKQSIVRLVSLSDGSEKSRIEFPGRVTTIGLDAKGARLVLLAEGPKEVEPKVKSKDFPQDLKGLERLRYEQEHDGKTSILAEFELPSGKKVREKTIFYIPGSSPAVIVRDEATYIVDYNNENAKIAGDDITLFEAASSYNYGIGIAPDRSAFLVGGLRDGTLVTLPELAMTTFDVDNLPGWPEYYKGFGFAPDGTGYGVTTAYRLVQIDPSGKVLKTAPIY